MEKIKNLETCIGMAGHYGIIKESNIFSSICRWVKFLFRKPKNSYIIGSPVDNCPITSDGIDKFYKPRIIGGPINTTNSSPLYPMPENNRPVPAGIYPGHFVRSGVANNGSELGLATSFAVAYAVSNDSSDSSGCD